MFTFLQKFGRFGNRPVLAILPAIAGVLAAVVLFAVAAPAAAQSTTPPTCSTQIMGTRFTLPVMLAGQEAVIPPAKLVGATSVCVEGLESAEGVALKLKGETPFTVLGNGTPLTVDDENSASLALGDPSFNGSLLKATPALPTSVKVEALSELSDGVTVWVGNPRPTVVAAVAIDQWQDVRIPGSLGELSAGTTKWAGNGVEILISSGAAFSANGTAVLPEPTKVGKYEFYVDSATQLVLAGTVPGQRFYLSVDADSLATDAWLQKRVEAQASPAIAAASTAGAAAPQAGGGGGDEAPRFYHPAIAPIWLPLLTHK